MPCEDGAAPASYAFPLSLLWYCLWSRGWRGLLLLLGLASLVFFPALIGEIVAAAVRG
jgi:hypothetical protein